jgi:hypothetical protein
MFWQSHHLSDLVMDFLSPYAMGNWLREFFKLYEYPRGGRLAKEVHFAV